MELPKNIKIQLRLRHLSKVVSLFSVGLRIWPPRKSVIWGFHSLRSGNEDSDARKRITFVLLSIVCLIIWWGVPPWLWMQWHILMLLLSFARFFSNKWLLVQSSAALSWEVTMWTCDGLFAGTQRTGIPFVVFRVQWHESYPLQPWFAGTMLGKILHAIASFIKFLNSPRSDL